VPLHDAGLRLAPQASKLADSLLIAVPDLLVTTSTEPR